MTAYRWCGNGCPPSDRLALCKAYIAKAAWDFATTRDLIDAILHRPALRRLCGWESLGEVPCEATFSRAFDAFARDGRPQQIHEATRLTTAGRRGIRSGCSAYWSCSSSCGWPIAKRPRWSNMINAGVWPCI